MEELEERLEMPIELSNDFTIREGDKNIIYRAKVSQMHFVRSCLFGCTELIKLEVIKQRVVNKGPWRLRFFWRSKSIVILEDRERELWHFENPSGILIDGLDDLRGRMFLWPEALNADLGNLSALIGIAAASPNRIILQNSLIHDAFGLIADKLLELWEAQCPGIIPKEIREKILRL